LRRERPFESKYFVATALCLSLCWAPTGMLLLLRHPSWETMQVADAFQSISEWLVLGFGITNVTQGLLGFWVGLRLLRRGQGYLAQLNWLFGYFGMFFILLYGWDGLGYDRFLYDRDMLPGSPAWYPGVATAAGVLPALWRFLRSGVAGTLYLDGAYLLPPFFWLFAGWIRDSHRQKGGPLPSPVFLSAHYLGGVLLIALGCAAACAVGVRGVAYLLGVGDHVARGRGEVPPATAAHVASYFIGLPLSLAALWFTVLRPGRLASRYLSTFLAPLHPPA
jgi:hypothetical protein